MVDMVWADAENVIKKAKVAVSAAFAKLEINFFIFLKFNVLTYANIKYWLRL
jgi:hypothetical protein